MAAPLKLTRTHRILAGLVVTGGLVIAGIGFAGSYSAVRALAERQGFGAFSAVFPIGIDAGICVLLALDLLLTWIRIPFPLLRQTAWLLTIATIAFNGAAAWPDPLGVGMHAVIPVLFVVSVEAARHAVGRIADITADKHMEGVRLTRWLLSPLPTFLLWRRMKLWELRSYDQTIRLEQERLIYQARLRSRFGRAWRRKAPIESLMPLRLARYGIPLAETAPAGLAAAGIEPVLLPPGPTKAELERLDSRGGAPGRTGRDGDGDDRTAAGPEDAAVDAQSPWFAPHQRAYDGDYDPSYDPSYAPEAEYEQWYAEQARHAQQAPGHPDPGAPAGPYTPHGRLPQPQGQPHPQAARPQGPRPQARVPFPQGTTGAPHPQQTDGAYPQQGDAAYPQQADARYAPQADAPFAADPGVPYPQGGEDPADPPFPVPAGPGRTRQLGGNHVSLPGPRQELSEEPAPEPVPVPEEETLAPGLPDDVSREEAYYTAFLRYVNERMDFPNARQFGLYLQSLFGVTGQSGGPLTESTLRPYLREFRERYQRSDADAEHIA